MVNHPKKMCQRCGERECMKGGFLICRICFEKKIGNPTPEASYWRKTNAPPRSNKLPPMKFKEPLKG